MEHAGESLLVLFVAFLAAIVGGEVAIRLKMPAVIGQILVGALIGKSALNLLPAGSGPSLGLMSELGATFLLFSVGLETPFDRIGKVGKEALLVAVLGVILPFVAGYGISAAFGYTSIQSAFVAAALVATSVGISAKVLQDLGVIDKRFSQVILGAAVIDDILAMLIISVISSMASGSGVSALQIAGVIAQSVGFLVVAIVLGRGVARRSPKILDKPKSSISPWSLSILLCIGVAALATKIGLAAIIGAFVIGMILAETDHREWIHEKVVDLNEFFVPFFFVATGLSLDLRGFQSSKLLVILVVITLAAIVTKFIGGALGASRDRAIVGIAMVPRGEVGTIVASLGLAFKVLDTALYSVLVAMSLLTTVFTVPSLSFLIAKADAKKRNGSDDQT